MAAMQKCSSPRVCETNVGLKSSKWSVYTRSGDKMGFLWSTDKLLRLWGKTKAGSEDPGDFHPALFHMLDVAQVARVMLGADASSRWNRILAESLGARHGDLATWLPWLIALHDIGKLSAPFQYQNESQRQRLIDEGFSFGNHKWDNRPSHGEISEVFIASGLNINMPGTLLRAIRDLAGGHHGFFSEPGKISENSQLLRKEPPEWMEARKAGMEVLRGLLLKEPDPWPEPPNVSVAVMGMTGFTILCDWLGSDNAYFPPHPEMPLEEYTALSEQ